MFFKTRIEKGQTVRGRVHINLRKTARVRQRQKRDSERNENWKKKKISVTKILINCFRDPNRSWETLARDALNFRSKSFFFFLTNTRSHSMERVTMVTTGISGPRDSHRDFFFLFFNWPHARTSRIISPIR